MFGTPSSYRAFRTLFCLLISTMSIVCSKINHAAEPEIVIDPSAGAPGKFAGTEKGFRQ